MKKIVSLCLVFVMAFAFVGCSFGKSATPEEKLAGVYVGKEDGAIYTLKINQDGTGILTFEEGEEQEFAPISWELMNGNLYLWLTEDKSEREIGQIVGDTTIIIDDVVLEKQQ